MRIQGMNLNGVSFFPFIEKEAHPTRHKYGALATITQNTDTISIDYPEKEIMGFKYNMNLTAFVNPFAANVDVMKIKETGLIRYGVYFPTDRWDDPKQPNTFPIIPDYNSTVWTQAAVDAGFITAERIGSSKATRYPNHGQQFYDLTNGLYGYNSVTNTPGQIDVLGPLIQHVCEWFKDLFGFYPSAASYRNGSRTGAYLMKSYFLGARNSIYDYNIVYDLSKEEAIDRSESTRQGDMDLSMTRAEVLQKCTETLQQAVSTGGWYSDFTHWHTMEKGEMEEYLSNQRNVIGGSDVVTLDYGTAVEYQFLRNMVRRSGVYTDGQELVLTTDVKNQEGIALRGINTTLSVEVNLTGTVLAGKEITGIGDRGIRKKSMNHFVVEVPYTQQDGFYSVRLKATSSPNYLNFTLPVIEYELIGSELYVETNQPTHIVVFKVTPSSTSVLIRSEEMSSSHQLEMSGIDLTTGNIYIGAITKERQSSLSHKIII